MDTTKFSKAQREASQHLYTLVRNSGLVMYSHIEMKDETLGRWNGGPTFLVVRWSNIVTGIHKYFLSLSVSRSGQCTVAIYKEQGYNSSLFLAEYLFDDVEDALVFMSAEHPAIVPTTLTKEELDNRGYEVIPKERYHDLLKRAQSWDRLNDAPRTGKRSTFGWAD